MGFLMMIYESQYRDFKKINFAEKKRFVVPISDYKSIGMRSRIFKRGPEDDLIQSVIEKPWPVDLGQHFVFKEPGIETWYPDLIAVSFKPEVCEIAGNRPILKKSSLQILSHIFFVKSTTPEEISKLTCHKKAAVLRSIKDLESSGMIFCENGLVRSNEEAFLFSGIVAIEAKIKDWKKAVQQAAQNRWFASQSYILIPYRKDFSEICSKASSLRIGVLSVRDGEVVMISPPEDHGIPKSYGAMMIHEWALRFLFQSTRA